MYAICDEDSILFYFRMLYIKLLTLEERVPGDTAECAGRKCPSIRVTITGGDLMDADCSGRDTPASPAQVRGDTKDMYETLNSSIGIVHIFLKLMHNLSIVNNP